MASEINKEYSVNWKNHMSHVRKAFDNLLTSNELTDVTLHCEGKKIGAHKMLLSACSGYFRDTFKDVPCQHPVIFMYGVEFGVLSDILRFIYNGEVSVDTAKLDMFLKTAQVLQISGLTDCPTERSTDENETSESVTQSPVVQRNVEENFEESVTPTSSTNDDARKGVKRSRVREMDTTNKVIRHERQEDDQVFLADVKSEPCEMVNFEDPLEDPLLQSEQANDSKDFYGAPGQSLGDEEFKPTTCGTSAGTTDTETDEGSTSATKPAEITASTTTATETDLDRLQQSMPKTGNCLTLNGYKYSYIVNKIGKKDPASNMTVWKCQKYNNGSCSRRVITNTTTDLNLMRVKSVKVRSEGYIDSKTKRILCATVGKVREKLEGKAVE